MSRHNDLYVRAPVNRQARIATAQPKESNPVDITALQASDQAKQMLNRQSHTSYRKMVEAAPQAASLRSRAAAQSKAECDIQDLAVGDVFLVFAKDGTLAYADTVRVATGKVIRGNKHRRSFKRLSGNESGRGEFFARASWPDDVRVVIDMEAIKAAKANLRDIQRTLTNKQLRARGLPPAYPNIKEVPGHPRLLLLELKKAKQLVGQLKKGTRDVR